ncbi:MAG: hypothetical protein KDE35_04045 [Geminicoccaceae bacterium]|nr:hypothetical protein [Geminicoccaceae bacterium]
MARATTGAGVPRYRMRVPLLCIGLFALVLVAAVPARSAGLEDYVGAFVGRADVEDPTTGKTGVRDFEIVVGPAKDGGFRIDWVNVSLVDGRRDVPGVERRAGGLIFRPVEGEDWYAEAPSYNPFKERDELAPVRGDPLRWASFGEDGLTIVSFVILEDGTYELQRTVRALDGDRLDLFFERIVDGVVVRRITGRGYRAD